MMPPPSDDQAPESSAAGATGAGSAGSSGSYRRRTRSRPPPGSRPRGETPGSATAAAPEDTAGVEPPVTQTPVTQPPVPAAAAGTAPVAGPPAVSEVPLLTLRDGLPHVVDTEAALAEACAALAAASGPVAIDAERASGYRYSARAYLVQLRRKGATTFLIDPIAFDSLAPLDEALGDTEWILHAATQDLPCLREVGLHPTSVFDTELAGRLLGYPRVGLATLMEEVLGFRMRKEHSASDWSTRPLPAPWLEYAALDVELLVELRDALAAELEEAGKAGWSREEFSHLLEHRAPLRVDPWRRTSGMHRVRGRRGLAAVRELWQTRDAIAQERDVTPGRIIPDQAVVVAAREMPTDGQALMDAKGFHGRGARRYLRSWLAALQRARELPEEELPARSARSDGPPPPRAWADRDPVAARRLMLAKEALTALADELTLPVENLTSPDVVRRALWAPPDAREAEPLTVALAQVLADHGARPWQVAHVGPLLVAAVLEADREAAAGEIRGLAAPEEANGSPDDNPVTPDELT